MDACPATPQASESFADHDPIDLRSFSTTIAAPIATLPKAARRKKIMKRSNSAPDCKHPRFSKIRIGLCAMDKKANSKPMREILARLVTFGEFDIVSFGDQVILEKPVEEWPLCDCMLSWYSDGFPLKKAQQYLTLRRPFLVNDVYMQDALLDRRKVYTILQDNSIPMPKHIVVNRDGLPPGADPEGFVEAEDWVEINGQRIDKPFVEKPASGEDHNIYIYYPYSMGGGVKRLFRKVNNKSGEYDAEHPGTVRRDGSFIYEEFLTTGGTDVKVYTVGPRYAHAEARKSPVVDGKVNRDPDGKEVRFPVLLSPQEKEIARMVCLAFAQKVCGFDLLRSETGQSYVCDVNGWSFVKNSKKYYDDCAGILRSIMLNALAPHRLRLMPTPVPVVHEEEGAESWRSESTGGGSTHAATDGISRGVGSLQDFAYLDGDAEDEEGELSERNQWEELRCVLAVIRHGDRTPKQKMKMKVTQAPLLELFEKYKDSKGKQAKLKSPSQLQELLDITRDLLQAMDRRAAEHEKGVPIPAAVAAAEEDKDQQDEVREKFRIVRTVLEQGGHFSGVNRKVQLKPVHVAAAQSDGYESEASVRGGGPGSVTGGGAARPPVKELLLILKYGGILTHAGRQQAEELGTSFRQVMYPRYGPTGGGLLRLHSTYRHDLKIYSSDEGRVQTSAAAFTKALLDLEGSSLTPILVSLVKKDASMLDAFGKGASEDIRNAKNALYSQMTWDAERSISLCNQQMSQMQVSQLFTPTSFSPPMSPAPRTSLTSPDRLVSPPSGTDPAHYGMGGGSSAGPPYQQQLTRLGSQGPPGLTQALQARNSGSAGSAMGHSQSAASFASCELHKNSSISSITGISPSNSIREAYSALSVSISRRESVDLGVVGMLQPPNTNRPAAPLGPPIPGMPEKPLELLRHLVSLIKVLVDKLREKCLGERLPDQGGGTPPVKQYSSLSQAPDEWEQEAGKPCGAERLLLMFDRWRKLLKSFYNEKKRTFDISKVPDIYDSAKYDAIHNAHLALDLKDLYSTAKILADVIIPNEYGLEPHGKLHIGSKICAELWGKLLADLASMREESIVTAAMELERSTQRAPSDASTILPGRTGSSKRLNSMLFDDEFGLMSLQDEQMRMPRALIANLAKQQQKLQPQPQHGGATASSPLSQACAAVAAEGGAAADEPCGGEADVEAETLHRLCPTYASDINSPLRHVRTRIYFTSESHIHSLMNVLRFCQLRDGGSLDGGLVCPEGQQLLAAATELDYLTHIVIRLYENKAVPITAPERFRVEIEFSPGANYNPFEVSPRGRDHALPTIPRTKLHQGDGVTLAGMEELLQPFATQRKMCPSIYALQVALRAPSANGSAGTSRSHSVAQMN